MKALRPSRKPLIRRHSERGLTLVELIVTVAILSILASAAIPIARFKVKRDNERQLRRDLWEMRDAIDHYKDAADKGAIHQHLQLARQIGALCLAPGSAQLQIVCRCLVISRLCNLQETKHRP